MKRYGYKWFFENAGDYAYIKVNTMPYRIPGKPNIALYSLQFDDNGDPISILMGSVSSPTFDRLVKEHVIFKHGSFYCYDLYFENDDIMDDFKAR